jgi:signal transduction histidine kinase
VQRFLDSAREGAERAATLTGRLLAFSRQQPLAPATLDANKLATAMSDMLRRTISEQIKIETVLAGGLWRVHADQTQLESAILNLSVNARDAMPMGGTLTITTANNLASGGQPPADRREGEAPRQVCLRVTDTGTGMAPDVVERIFEPFFTSKGLGEGTGLGLAVVHGIVEQSGGHIEVQSEPGAGSTFAIHLPASEPASVGAAEPASTAERNGHESILLVEDEASLRNLAARALRARGFSVMLAGDGA